MSEFRRAMLEIFDEETHQNSTRISAHLTHTDFEPAVPLRIEHSLELKDANGAFRDAGQALISLEADVATINTNALTFATQTALADEVSAIGVTTSGLQASIDGEVQQRQSADATQSGLITANQNAIGTLQTDVTNLTASAANASNITSGTLDAARLPVLTVAAGNVTGLAASATVDATNADNIGAVSYTHLTLPTICSV